MKTQIDVAKINEFLKFLHDAGQSEKLDNVLALADKDPNAAFMAGMKAVDSTVDGFPALIKMLIDSAPIPGYLDMMLTGVVIGTFVARASDTETFGKMLADIKAAPQNIFQIGEKKS